MSSAYERAWNWPDYLIGRCRRHRLRRSLRPWTRLWRLAWACAETILDRRAHRTRAHHQTRQPLFANAVRASRAGAPDAQKAMAQAEFWSLVTTGRCAHE